MLCCRAPDFQFQRGDLTWQPHARLSAALPGILPGLGSTEGEQGGFSRKWGSLNSRFGVIGVERGQWASRNCVQNISSINIS